MKARVLTKETVLDYGIFERNFPEFRPGDTIEVAQTVKDGDKERTQYFEGDVISFSHNGISTSFTVRRIGANGVGVEKIFPYYSKMVTAIRVVKHGKVRRANLGYVREKLGKSARLKERIQTQSSNAAATSSTQASAPAADNQ